MKINSDTQSSSKDDCLLRDDFRYHSQTLRQLLSHFEGSGLCSAANWSSFTLLSPSYTQTLGSQSHCHSLTLAHATANHKLSLRSASQPITLTLLTSLNAQLQILHFLSVHHFSIHALVISSAKTDARPTARHF